MLIFAKDQLPIPSFTESADFISNYSTHPDAKQYLRPQIQTLKNKGFKKETDDFDNLYLVHVTNYFPDNGVIIPRGKLTCPEQNPIYKQILDIISILRPTIHFSVGHINSNINNYKFIIVDKFNATDHQIVGGYIEDLFTLGHYKLSKSAFILIDTSKEDLPQKQIEFLKSRGIQFHYYSQNPEEALENALKERNAKILMVPTPSKSEPKFVCKIKGTHTYITSESLAKHFNIKYTSDDVTPSHTIVNIFSYFATQVMTAKPYITYSKTSQEILTYTQCQSYEHLTAQYINAMRDIFATTAQHGIFLRHYGQVMKYLSAGFDRTLSAKDGSLYLSRSMASYDKEIISTLAANFLEDTQAAATAASNEKEQSVSSLSVSAATNPSAASTKKNTTYANEEEEEVACSSAATYLGMSDDSQNSSETNAKTDPSDDDHKPDQDEAKVQLISTETTKANATFVDITTHSTKNIIELLKERNIFFRNQEKYREERKQETNDKEVRLKYTYSISKVNDLDDLENAYTTPIIFIDNKDENRTVDPKIYNDHITDFSLSLSGLVDSSLPQHSF